MRIYMNLGMQRNFFIFFSEVPEIYYKEFKLDWKL